MAVLTRAVLSCNSPKLKRSDLSALKIRLVQKEWLGKFRYMEDIPAGSYKNQVNAVTSMNTAVGIAVNKNLSEDVVYYDKGVLG